MQSLGSSLGLAFGALRRPGSARAVNLAPSNNNSLLALPRPVAHLGQFLHSLILHVYNSVSLPCCSSLVSSLIDTRKYTNTTLTRHPLVLHLETLCELS